ESIFNSQDPGCGMTVGQPLIEQLKQALVKAQVVLLIYTFADEDWSFCMWELGVATDPKNEHTNSVVFCCSRDTPKVFEGQILVEMTKDDLEKFVHQLHKRDKFFAGEKPYQDIPPEEVQKRSQALYDDLIKVVPFRQSIEIFRWDNFRLQIETDTIEQLHTLFREAESNDEEIHNMLSKGSHVLGEPPPFGQSQEHFGFHAFEEKLTLETLIDRWKVGKKQCQDEKIEGWAEATDDWIPELYSELKRAVNNQAAQPPRYLMRSLVPDTNWWFYPVLNHVSHLPNKSMQLDLYFYRFRRADPGALHN
ncbi:MAG: hypothetical protein OEY77_07500, partial [Nitrospira sp.]|nr:hypothetical protein [Nitrospira sp.]